MKKMVAGLMALAAVAAVAQAENVYSKNAVGFVNVEMTGGNLYALSLPFVSVGTTEPIAFTDTSIAADAANGSAVFFWNVEDQKWTTVTKLRNKFNTTHKLEEGEFFFFKPSNNMTATLTGEVPSFADSEVPVYADGALSAIAYPYPNTIAFNDTKLAAAAPNGSAVFFWNVADQKWDTVTKLRNKFNTTKTLEPGTGVFFKSAASNDISWKEDKLYSFP